MDKKVLIGIAGAAIAGGRQALMMLGGGASAATGKYDYETVEVGRAMSPA